MSLESRLARLDLDWIIPDWPAPSNVRAVMTTRNADIEDGARRSMNLGRAAGDAVVGVTRNRVLLRDVCGVDTVWLSQVHGTTVARIDDAKEPIEADGALATQPGRAASIRVADCLPVLFCTRDGRRVAAAHAGWRGLNAGILEETVAAIDAPGREILAWLGPAIGARAFEVGDDVHRALVDRDPNAAIAFVPYPEREGKWLCDLYALARMRLRRMGIESISGGGFCTVTDESRFFSYRRDKSVERMAATIWIEPRV